MVRLPPTLLSHRVAPEVAIGLRNPDEKEPRPLRWQALAAALDPIDIMPGMSMIWNFGTVPNHMVIGLRLVPIIRV